MWSRRCQRSGPPPSVVTRPQARTIAEPRFIPRVNRAAIQLVREIPRGTGADALITRFDRFRRRSDRRFRRATAHLGVERGAVLLPTDLLGDSFLFSRVSGAVVHPRSRSRRSRAASCSRAVGPRYVDSIVIACSPHTRRPGPWWAARVPRISNEAPGLEMRAKDRMRAGRLAPQP